MKENYRLKYNQLVRKIKSVNNDKLGLDPYKKYVLKINGKYVKEHDFWGKPLKVSKHPKQLALFDNVEVCLFYRKHLLDEVEVIEYSGKIQTELEVTTKRKGVITLEEVVSCGITEFQLYIDTYPNSAQQRIQLFHESDFFELTEYVPEIENKGYNFREVVCIRDCGKNKAVYPHILDIIVEKKVIDTCNNGTVTLPLHKLKY